MPPLVCPSPEPATWRHYPYQLVAGDPQLVFPAAEGHQQDASDTYYASGFLRGETSGRHYAFLTIFAKNENIFDLLSADLHVLAVFDLDAGTYDTGSRFDLPPERQFNRDRINVTRGRLDVSYTSARRVSRMRARSDAGGGVIPFAYEFDLSAETLSGTPVALHLCADARKPPQAVGGAKEGGRITVYGQANTYSYFQTLGYTGRLSWADIDEPVSGRIGWLDRQWFPEYAGRYAGLLADRYGHQWAQISLANDWELSLWRQFDRKEDDRLVAFTGLTASDPSGRTIPVDDFTVDILSYLRDPGLIDPLLASLQHIVGRRSSIRYFFDEFRLRAPSLCLDVVTSPLIAAPAHQMPIDYFSGPMRITGRMNGHAVSGLGFHERSLPLSSPEHLVTVLRDTVLNMPNEAAARGVLTVRQLADLISQTNERIADRHILSAAHFVEETVRPALMPIAESHRHHVLRIADDLISQLSPFA